MTSLPASSGTPPSALLAPLISLVAPEMAQMDVLIQGSLTHGISLIPLVGGHLISSGGKRLRPMLLIACAKLCGYTGDDHIKLATCLEFIHNATLLHDDVMDKSELRRGVPTAHTVWGTAASIVVGDFLLCRALELMTEVESWPIVRLINSMATKIIEGQTLDLSLSHRLDIKPQDYLEMIHLKTAWLFQGACELGALVSHHDQASQLRDFGYRLGMAFQLMDDVLDYTSSAERLGKNPGQDFREGKVTLPVLLAYEKGAPAERAFWERTIQAPNQTEEDFQEALALMRAHKVFETVIGDARAFLDQAAVTLNSFPPSPLQKALYDILTFIHQQL